MIQNIKIEGSRLTVIGEAPPRVKPCGAIDKCSICKCECGTIKVFRNCHLSSGRSRSCGCLRKDKRPNFHYIHGHARTGKISATWRCWSLMKSRCSNPKDNNFKRYGGRGISVCKRWDRFENFLHDMGEKPNGKQIDRINNNGNYDPGNCRWATRKQQTRNTRRNIFMTFRGTTACLSELCEKFKMGYHTVYARLGMGWSVESALSTPVRPMKKYEKASRH